MSIKPGGDERQQLKEKKEGSRDGEVDVFGLNCLYHVLLKSKNSNLINLIS